jgi:hypothetical protein
MHLARRNRMKIYGHLWVLTLAISACGGIGTVQTDMDASAGIGGTAGSGGNTGAGGATLTLTSPVSAAGAAGSAIGGSMGAAGSPAVFPPMTIDGTSTGSVPGIDGTSTGYLPADGTGTPTTTTTTTTPIDALPPTPTGQLTAGSWDDNLNFGFYSTYLANEATTQLSGMPIIGRADRMVILVRSADAQPVAGAQVSVTDAQGHGWSSTTGAEGRVLYFPGWAAVSTGATVTITATVANLSVSTTAAAAAGTIELDFAQTALPTVTGLDLAFLIDTTGSMGDELTYVQSELDDIVGGIATQFPGINQRWALVLYRDLGDEYVVRSFDFTTDLASFRANLAAQSANGGGDMPEAVDQGLAAATQLGWRDGATARVAFWIADAPHHVGLENKVVSALGAAVAKAIHIYPVAGSGIDDLGEFDMRTAAEVTGGRYLFLTNDSGIGGSHAEPHIPCYYVTTLESAMRRMVATEVMGVYMPPAPSDILRTGGDPQNQQCTLSSGEPVTAW